MVFVGNSRAVIFDCELVPLVVVFHRHVDAAIGAIVVFDCIADEIGKDLGQSDLRGAEQWHAVVEVYLKLRRHRQRVNDIDQ